MLLKPQNKKLISTTKLWIDNKEVESKTKEWIDLRNPATDEIITRVPKSTPLEMAQAMESCKNAYKKWSQTSIIQRQQCMFKLQELIKRDLKKIAENITQEQGKTLPDAEGDVMRGLQVVEHACSATSLLQGESLSNISKDLDTISYRVPLGVTAGITPFNFPAMIPLWMFPVSLVCGNTVLIKPSERDPGACMMLMKLCKEAGIPDGCVNVIHGAHEGEASTSDLPVHMAEYTNNDRHDTIFGSVEQFVTTFVLEMDDKKNDIILNIFEGPKKYVESGVKFLPKKSSPKIEKRLVIDLNIFPRHRLNQFQYSDDYLMKDFIDKRISISKLVVDHFIPYHPAVDSNLILVPKSHDLRVSSLNPLNPATPKIMGKSTRALLFNFRHLIRNDRQLEALFRGVFNGQNIVTITDGLADEKSLIFATNQLKLIKIRFFTIRSDMLDTTKRVMTLKNREQHIEKSYSIILRMEAEHIGDTVMVVVDKRSDLRNVESFIDSCAGRSRRSANACGISLDELPRPKNPRLRRIFDKVGKISSITAHGILLKDMLGDLLSGDLVGLAVNLGIVSTGVAISQGVEKLSKIVASEKSAMGFSLKLGAPFLRRLTSGFIIYDLISNIQNYKDDTSAVSIAQDTTFLLVDAMDIGSEIAQALGFTTAEFLGPLGFTVGIALFVGGDIYKAVKTVENVDRLFHLTANEKWELGARLFFHMDVKSILQKAEWRHTSEQKAESVIKALKGHNMIRYYVSTIDSKHNTVIYFDYLPFQYPYSRNRLICTSDPTFLSFRNLYKDDLQLLTCQNAFIVENGNYTKPCVIFMDLRNTSSQVIGFSNYSHIFSISNAEYDITGGNGNDIFVVGGNSIKGYLDGAEGFDTLDLGQIDPYSSVNVTPETLGIDESYICFRNVNYVKGRLESYDYLETWPELEKIDLLGGADYYSFDQIHVYNHSNLQVTVRNLTNITFHEEITGNFVTTFPYLTSWSDIRVRRNSGNTTFLFLMNFESSQANMKKVDDTLYFQWNKIYGCIDQLCIIKFKDNLTIHTKKYIAELTKTNMTFDQIINKYDKIHRLLKCLLVVQIMPEDAVMLFAYSIPNSKSTILHNDPSRKTHFLGSVGENIFAIKSIDNQTLAFKDVTIHRNLLKTENFTDIIDIKFVKNSQHKFICSILNEDVFIQVNVQNKFFSKIMLKNFATLYQNLFMIGNVPMKIEVNKSCVVRPVPLKFNRNETLIIIKSTDVEYDHQIVVERSIGKRHVFYNDNNDMILSDFFFASRNNTGFMLILESFYEDEKMRTLTIEISGKMLDWRSEEFDKDSAFDIHFLERILY